MTKIVFDTDILIDYLRINHELFPRLVHLQRAGQAELFLSSISVMELFSGLSSKKSKNLKTILGICTVIPFDSELAQFAGELKRDRKFPSVPLADYIVGSTALWLKAQLATRNKKHFQGIPGLKFFKFSNRL
jgi:predicted nucleic acid-binding protein